MPHGILYLIPTTLGDYEPLEVLPTSVKTVVEKIDNFIVENEKTARRFIKRICPEKPQNHLQIALLNKHTQPTDLPTFLNPCLAGRPVGVLSEAGCPGIADPGAEVIALAHEKNIRVKPLVGPSAILMAMMSSGLNGQNFAFNGYLPIDRDQRKRAIKQFEKHSFNNNQSQLFIETPYRNNKLLEDLCHVLAPDTQLCIACDISQPTEVIKTQSIRAWKTSAINLHKRPVLFIFHKYY